MSADANLSKTQTFKITQSTGFLGAFLSKINKPFMKVTVPLAEDILILLRLAIAPSSVDAGI